MTTIELEFSEDVRDWRNMSDTDRWLSIAAGLGLAAYGLIGRRGVERWTLAGSEPCWWGGVRQAIVIRTSCSASTRRALARIRAGRSVALPGEIVDEGVVINQPIELLYRFWRNLENLPRFMRHLESVERVTDTLSRWRAKGPAGTTVEWNAEIINEVANRVIGWQSMKDRTWSAPARSISRAWPRNELVSGSACNTACLGEKLAPRS